jgi:ATP-dependent protease ClpP protease subunit
MNWYAISETNDNEAEVSIYDEIGGWGIGAKEFLGEISKLKGKHLHVRINSPGGSVVEGTAIFNALRRHEGGVTVHIDALAASMASVIAMAGVPVYMADNALLMIHNPWTITMGDSDDLRKEADLMDKLKVNIRNAYKRKTGLADEQLQDMMDAETWLDSIDAVALGFVDAIEEGVAAAAKVKPAELRARFDKFARGMDAEQTPATEPAPEPEAAGQQLPDGTPVVPVPEVEAPAPADEPEVTEPEVPVVDEPEATEPQASVGAALADAVVALNARLQAAEARAQAAEARIVIADAEISRLTQDHDRLARSLGIASASVVPELNTAAGSKPSLLEEYSAIKDPAERSAFYRKHRAELSRLVTQPAKQI